MAEAHGVPGWTLDIGPSTWLALAVLVVLPAAAALFYYARSLPRLAWQGGVMVLAALTAWAITDLSGQFERAALKRTLDERGAELTARALLPGSSLACLDGLASPTLEQGCQKALFASPETVAAALAYVEARLALIAEAQPLIASDAKFAARVERSRRALEADRYGMLGQALAARGCTATQCPAFAVLRDPRAVSDNIRDRSFETALAQHASGWGSDQAALASAHPPQASVQTPTPMPVPDGNAAPALDGPSAAAHPPGGAPVASKYDFPSSDSIPAVSIMDPEQARPPAATQKPAPAQQRRAARPATPPASAPAPATEKPPATILPQPVPR